MKAESFFGGRWVGSGVVTGISGRALRRFTTVFSGFWSEANSAFHVDEVIDYSDGLRINRPWIVHSDGFDTMVGYEADRGGRMLITETKEGFRVRYDRLRLSSARDVLRVTLDVRVADDNHLIAQGAARLLGVALGRTKVEFTRLTNDQPLAR